MPHDVFISYSRRDLAAVKPIKEELERLGFSCWMDLEGIESGSPEFTEKIAEAIGGSTAVLFFLSTASQSSRWSLNELRVARDEGKHVVLVRFNDDRMIAKFKLEFGGTDIIDWRAREQKRKLLSAFASQSGKSSAGGFVAGAIASLLESFVGAGIGACLFAKPRTFLRNDSNGPTRQLEEIEWRADALCKEREDVERQLKELHLKKTTDGVTSFGSAGPSETGSDLGVGVVAPATVPRGNEMLVQIVVDCFEGLSDAIEKAKSLDAENHAVERGSLPIRGVRRGARMTFQFDAKNFQLDDGDRVQEQIWEGLPFSIQFTPLVPDGIRKGTHSAKVMVSVDGMPVGRIGFVVNVADDVAQADGTAETTFHGYREYFASYSDKDLDRVVPRIQGLRSGGREVHIFFDKLSLRSGDRYEKEILEYIDDKADVFLLFWSANSAASEWVEKEWRRALARQKNKGGVPDIVPVPLDRNGPPPPSELSDLHFNDSLLFVLGGPSG